MAKARAPRTLRRADVLFGTAWRAAPLLLVVCVLIAFGTAVLGLIYPLGFREIVDGATEHQTGRIVTGLVIVAVAFPGSWVLQLVGAAFNSRLTDAADVTLGQRLGELAGTAPFLEHFERPDYLSEFDTLRARRRTLAAAPSQCLGVIRSGIMFVGAAVMLALVWPPLMLVPLLAVAPSLADRWAARLEKRSDDDLADPRRLRDELFSLASTAAPARELRTFGVTEALLERHARLSAEINKKSLRTAHLAALCEAAGWVVYALGFAGTIVALVLRATHGSTTPGSVVLAVSVLRRAQRQVTGATNSAGNFSTAVVTADRLLWFEDYVASVTVDDDGEAPERLTSGIRLDGVGFTYPAQETPVLRDVDLTLKVGSTVAIVGENGAGKSTLIKLLTGMYRPTEGTVTVDGRDLAGIAPRRWRAVTTGAFQDFAQYFMALRDGVGAGDLPRIDDREAVRSALHEADADALLEQLPDGLDTVLGPFIGGRSLSGGQWQRLALARGLMREQPLVVVLDEPTASLDAQAEAALFARYQRAARRLGEANGTITLLVSHRFSSVPTADQIVVMEDGRVVETGDHAELMSRDGLYAEMFALQAKGYS